MKEIKFRVWDKYDNEMKYDAQDTYDYIVNNIMEDCFGDVLKSERYEVMQYIGIKDKNGKEIYEGDILLDDETNTPLKVYFNENDAKFAISNEPQFPMEWLQDLEILGNIYENPELLGE